MRGPLQLSRERLQDRSFFASMSQTQRQEYLQQMLTIHQEDGDLSKLKRVRFPNRNFFEFEGQKLNYNYFEVNPNPKAVLFYFHGLYSHSNNGGLLGEIVSKKCNINVYGLDFLNAGSSQNDEPGYYQSIQYLVEQAYQFISFTLTKYKNKPKIFICGASMGGLVSFQLTLRHPSLVSGIIFLGPALRQVVGYRQLQKKIGHCFACFMPKGRLIPQMFDDRTRLKTQQILRSDTQNYLGNHVFSTTMNLLGNIKWISQNFNKLNTPYIIFQGGNDKYVDPFAPIDLEKQSSTKDKTTIYYRRMWHDIPLEIQYEQICQISAFWLRQRI